VSQSDTDPKKTGVEPDLLPLGTLAAWFVGLTAIVILVVVGVWQYFHRAIERELLDKDLGRAHPALVETKARDEQAQTTFAQLDAKTGVYRLTTARAVELLVADPTLIGPLAAAPAQAGAQEAATTPVKESESARPAVDASDPGKRPDSQAGASSSGAEAAEDGAGPRTTKQTRGEGSEANGGGAAVQPASAPAAATAR
jgi:hypothetical protein